jgi:uncharacterized damage-inducible protein DinB
LIVEQNLHFLRQGLALLGSLGADLYAARDGGRSPIGAHLRHCVDYYRCLLRGLDTGRVDYDAREREAELESDVLAAGRALREIAERLSAIAPGDYARPLEVKVDTPAESPFAWNGSTVGRELRFLVSHTVHHYALIGMMLRERGVDPGDDFGVAPSTQEYRRSVAAGAG